MKKLTYILMSIIFISSCSTLKIQKIDGNSEIKTNGIIYSLPQSKLDIEFKIIKTRYFKGPFSDYSKEYLGFNNVIEKDDIKYSIASINIEPSLINDTSQMYFITGKSKNYNYINNTLVLKSINKNDDFINKENKYHYDLTYFSSDDKNYIAFKDITIRPLVIEKNDTIWKNILVDSVYKRVPKISKAIAPSTTKEQAFDASKFIFKIRKRRLRVLAGMDDKFPKGDALKKIIKELNKLEESYIELFTGKTICDTTTYTFSIVPDNNNTEFTLNFDENNGFNNNANNEVIIKINKASTNNVLNKISEIKSNNAFTYRIPENANITIEYDNNTLYNTSIPVSQFGYVYYIDKNNLNKEILFDKKTGNLLYIK